MLFTLSVGVTYNCTSKKIPTWKFYIIDRYGNIPNGDMMYNTLIEHDVQTGIPEEGYHFKSTVDIEDTTENEYTLVIEHLGADYSSDYDEGPFGIDIDYVSLCEVDVCDLIHRRGHTYLDCTQNINYIFEQLNNDNFSVDIFPHEVNNNNKNYRLLNYRHDKVVGNNPKVFNNETEEYTEFNGCLITDDGYVIKGNKLYYDTTDNLYFIAKHANNKNLYVEGEIYIPKFTYNGVDNVVIENVSEHIHKSRLIHHIPNSSCLSQNGKWELAFKTPLYGWITDNIFGNDLA
jgi:hypothetical protein